MRYSVAVNNSRQWFKKAVTPGRSGSLKAGVGFLLVTCLCAPNGFAKASQDIAVFNLTERSTFSGVELQVNWLGYADTLADTVLLASTATVPIDVLRRADDYLGRWGIVLLVVFLLLALLANLLLKRRVQHNRALLQTNKEMLATILDSVDAFIYIKSPTLEYQYVNRRISDLFGLPALSLIHI